MSVETAILSRFVENKITNRLGFNSRDLPQKGRESYLSLQIHLAHMKLAGEGLDSEEARDLQDLIRMRRLTQLAGVEANLRFYRAEGVVAALREHQAQWKTRPKPQDISSLQPKPKESRIVSFARAATRTAGLAAATLAIAWVSGGLWQRYIDAGEKFDQLKQTYRYVTDESPEEIKAQASNDLSSLAGEYNNELEVRFDNWGASPGAMATGFGLMMTPALTLGMGALTLAPLASAFGMRRKPV